jgi:hypothetical protein
MSSNIIDLTERMNQMVLDEINRPELLPETEEGRCENYHGEGTNRDFERELRHGNPDVLCRGCDGSNEDCPYNQ